MKKIRLTECPRDAMQGLHNFVPTDVKAEYINRILRCGFDTVDFGSFVSPKAIPQMQDTASVLDKLDLAATSSKLLAIIANLRGAEEAVQHNGITYLGFPFSISETFQMRNTNSSIEDSFITVDKIQNLCEQRGKKLRVYLSMGFGNPYGDDWSIDILQHWANKISATGVRDIYLSDTVGIATSQQISEVFNKLKSNDDVAFGAHLHSTPDTWYDKIDAAYQAGCRSFDSAIKGYGGCPMAKDVLTGNIATENVLGYLQERKLDTGVDMERFANAMAYAGEVFA
ncbi:hydroxymethylglutaryl-CoA lyase [Mucilaginibacter myungsuensis]|uniref:Hydroxymethylglutaryl-CoA lyase n=1 Tax=Mucilaginibacter myungsuensis TaxID=649104 RepID=A0A929PXQ1_9SPHI|nr:hydroxymethylglutaryl-CoA lyase [Mucilaginibacter myungsuensis]MBE9662497.1 hydroxymethylglutaryl-CoA lyase [Mucilaginibacter myungsuensis]MDN3597916.1 hydroxymethylglutaryl-CoA lyase [Mucilaginibacter myungsuensis]